MGLGSFRKDINGLRAIGVVAVIIFHFNANWLPGGFAGVDIFFVISGYLMTGLIVSGLSRGKFSLAGFYFSRAKRIIPALAVLSLSLLILGWFLLAPGDYKTLAKHIEKSITFTSNITYFQDAGYFDLASHKKWLLHTWSLSVEWQFYLIYPLILLFCNRLWGQNSLKWVVTVGTVVSFAFCVSITQQNPNESFFLLPYRAWEMLLGGVIFLFPVSLRPNVSRSLEYLGMIAILGALILLSSDLLWPGAWAAIPVTGTALILLAQRNDSILTSNPISQKIGTVSYSLYLWHWPIYAVIYYLGYQNNPGIILLSIGLSFILGALSYYGVERRAFFIHTFLDIQARKPVLKVAALLLSVPILIIPAVFCGTKFVRNSDGAASRIDSYIFDNPELFLTEPPFSEQCHENAMELPRCVLSDAKNLTRAQPDFILLGDSHADVVSTAIAQAVANIGGKGLLLFTKGGCLFVPGIRNTNKPQDADCSNLTEDVLHILYEQYPTTPVIVVNRLRYYFGMSSDDDRQRHHAFLVDNPPANYRAEEIHQINTDVSNGYMDFICSLSKTREVYILTPTPEFEHDVIDHIARNILFNDNRAEIITDVDIHFQQNEYVHSLLKQTQNRCGTTLIDPIPALCDSDTCHGVMDGLPLYQDKNHLNEYGNRLLIPVFEKELSTGLSNSSRR